MRYCILLLLVSAILNAQTITPQVINSAGGGGTVGITGVEVYYNVGEPIITTVGNGSNFITQGFLQPDVVGEFGLVASSFITPNSCADKTDGSIKVSASVSGAVNQTDFIISYYWNPSSLCSSNTCSLVSNLPAGNYSVMVVAQHTAGVVSNDTVRIQNIIIFGSSEPCQVSVFNGVSPNGDGDNDFFVIESIENFPENKVEIYSRWGQKLFETKNYNNLDNVWKGTLSGGNTTAPSGTYFYIIDLGNGSKPIKGWLELTSGK